MRIAKPLLLTTTSIGLALGLYEAWELAGGLMLLPVAMILGCAVAFGGVIATIRREKLEGGRS